MSRKRSWTDRQMREAIEASETVSDALRKLGLAVRPGNYTTVRNFVKKHGLDLSHMTGKAAGRGGVKRRSLSEILVKNSTYNRSHLKARLIKEGILSSSCSLCGQGPHWKGKDLVLVLDHTNGINNDNRLENLRLLCPNCNSQQPTFCRGQ